MPPTPQALPMRDLVPIGQFSKICRIPVRLLRHYDEIGLLHPAAIDPSSSYRYYQMSQVLDAEIIRLLRALDMPLAEIKIILCEADTDLRRFLLDTRQVDSDAVLSVLEQHEARLAQRVADGMRALAQLRRLRSLQAGPTVADVTMQLLPAEHVVALQVGGTGGETSGLLRQAILGLRAYLGAIGQRPTGPPGSIFPTFDGSVHNQALVEMEVFLPVDISVRGVGQIQSKQLPAGAAATIRYVGPYTLLSRCYRALTEWIDDHGRHAAGPLREIYWAGPEAGIAPTNYETQVVWPLDSPIV
jgi:DNA-binding transcriptional MerR regulator